MSPRFESGWIKLYRKLSGCDVGTNGYCLAIMATLLMWASRFPSTIRWRGKPRDIPAGSVLIGIRELADHLQFSKDTVYRQLKYLAERDTIRLETATQGTLVTIQKWEEYQTSDEILRHAEGHECDTAKDASRTLAERQPTLNGEDKKERSKNKASASHPLLEIWNENRGQLPEAKALSKGRKKSAEARWSENPSREYWIDIAKKIATSPFCRGEKNDPNGTHASWKADFDFFLKAETHIRVLEGKYSNGTSQSSTVKTFDDLDAFTWGSQ